MVDSGPVIMEQMHEIERMFINYKQHKLHMDETILSLLPLISFLLYGKTSKEI